MPVTNNAWSRFVISNSVIRGQVRLAVSLCQGRGKTLGHGKIQSQEVWIGFTVD